jgi:Tfp pilus assembly protein PilZ
MKRLLVGDGREDLLSTLEVILKHWGYRVLVSSKPANVAQALREAPPDVLILGDAWLIDPPPELAAALDDSRTSGKPPIIVLGSLPETARPGIAEALQAPVDLFRLFELVQRLMQNNPRRNLRLTVSIPGMVCRDESSQLAEVISISTRGLFIRTSFRMDRGDRFRVVLPLLGMKRELELEGEVLYRMEPGPSNNYRQGIGIEFVGLSGDQQQALKDFLEKRLLEELVESQRGSDLDTNQIRLHSRGPLSSVKSD